MSKQQGQISDKPERYGSNGKKQTGCWELWFKYYSPQLSEGKWIRLRTYKTRELAEKNMARVKKNDIMVFNEKMWEYEIRYIKSKKENK